MDSKSASEPDNRPPIVINEQRKKEENLELMAALSPRAFASHPLQSTT
jgi:hypothetical protein